MDEYEDDEAGQKERKREDAVTQQNTMQNEAVSLLDPGSSYLLQVGIYKYQMSPASLTIILKLLLIIFLVLF